MTERALRWWEAHPVIVHAILVAAVALAASATSLTNGFAFDDIPIIEANPSVHELRAPWTHLRETYWGPSLGAGALYRPLAIFGYSLQWAVGGGSPFVFHLVNIALYVAVAVAALAMLRQLLPGAAAFVGALLFAAHPVHVEAVGNVVGQAELWVALAVVVSVTLYARERRHGALTRRTGAAILICYAGGLLFKEHGIVLPGLLLAIELYGRATTFTRQEGDWERARVLTLLLVLVAAVYLVARVRVLGGVTGSDTDWALRGLGVGARSLVMLGLVPEFARLLVWPARLYADYSPQLIQVHSQWSVAHLPGALLLAGVVALAIGLRRRALHVALGVTWFACTIALVSNVPFASGVLIAERTIFLPSLGLALVAGPMLAWPLTQWRGAALTAARTVVVSVLTVAVAHSAVRQRVWEDNATLFGTLVAEAPENFRGHFAVGEMYAIGGRFEAGDEAMQRSLALYPEFGPARLTRARILHFRGLCNEALPEYERVLAADPEVGLAKIGRAACLVDLGQLHAARQAAMDGLFVEGMEPAFQIIRRAADSLLMATDSADVRNRWKREGLPFDRTGRPVRIWVIRDVPTLKPIAGRMQETRPSAYPD